MDTLTIDFAGVAAGEKMLVFVFAAKADRAASIRENVKKERPHRRSFCSSFLEG
jgi:hypothetical protein